MDETAPAAGPEATALPGVGIWRSIALCVVFYVVISVTQIALGKLLELLFQSEDFSRVGRFQRHAVRANFSSFQVPALWLICT